MGGIIGSIAGGIGASSATGDSNQGLNNANNIWTQYLQQLTSSEQPYTSAGTGAINNLSQLLGTTANNGTSSAATGGAYGSLTQPFSTADFQSDPGYQFRLQQGQGAVNAANAAQGISPISGAGLKGLDAYTQGLASQDYQQAYNNYQTNQNNTYSRLMGTAGLGQSAQNQVNQGAGATANAQSGIQNQIGQNYASNDLAQANAWGTGLTSVFNNGAQFLGGASAGSSNTQAGGASSSVNWNQPTSDGSSGSSGGGMSSIASLLPMLLAFL